MSVPPTHHLPAEFPLILDALAAAGRLTRTAQESLRSQHLQTKTDGSIVTVADYAAQALINHRLSLAGVPLPAVIGEESAAALNSHPTLLNDVVSLLRSQGWPDASPAATLAAIDLVAASSDAPPPSYYTIDPIDGTKGFAAGRQFAVCLARIDSGRCTLAALACPNLSPSNADPLDPPAPVGTLFAATDASHVLTARMTEPTQLTLLPLRPTPRSPSPSSPLKSV
jgi:3'(2'), 5'-bisphosphate nucleotidase